MNVLGASEKDNKDVITDSMLLGRSMSAPLVVFGMEWIIEMTSISVSPPRIFMDGVFSEMVVEVEDVQGYGLRDIGIRKMWMVGFLQ